jgi:hypothetical protein
VRDLRKRFACDVIRREPIDRTAWMARLRREAGGGDGEGEAGGAG